MHMFCTYTNTILMYLLRPLPGLDIKYAPIMYCILFLFQTAVRICLWSYHHLPSCTAPHPLLQADEQLVVTLVPPLFNSSKTKAFEVKNQ